MIQLIEEKKWKMKMDINIEISNEKEKCV